MQAAIANQYTWGILLANRLLRRSRAALFGYSVEALALSLGLSRTRGRYQSVNRIDLHNKKVLLQNLIIRHSMLGIAPATLGASQAAAVH